ncbi:MAG: NTP/NDP exchange transporter [Planctomycetota bacterium]
MPVLRNLLRKVVRYEPHELRALLWAFAFFYFVLAAYYVLRPLRESFAVKAELDLLASFSLTFGIMLIVMPLYELLVARFQRRMLVALVYRFFMLQIGAFWLLFAFFDAGKSPGISQCFFVWLTVFNVLIVAVFWSVLVDLFNKDQGRRLFGFIAAGGTFGALSGSIVTSTVAQQIGSANIFVISFCLLEAAVQCSRYAVRAGRAASTTANTPVLASARDAENAHGSDSRGPRLFTGLQFVLRSNLLLFIALYLLCATISASFGYAQQNAVVRAQQLEDDARTQLFANINLVGQLLAGLLQAVFAARIVRRFGLGVTLAVLPVFHVLANLTLGCSPYLAPMFELVIIMDVLRRGIGLGLTTPAREVLFTTLPSEQKYPAKYFIDTVVFRGGDAVALAIYRVTGAAADIATTALLVAPLGLVWAALALLLGRLHADGKPARGGSSTGQSEDEGPNLFVNRG